MPAKVEELIEKLKELAPEELAESWDNIGLQIGSVNNKVSKILLALDATPSIIDEALTEGVDMIVTHHPFIFSPLEKIVQDTPIGVGIYKLIQKNISLYAMHTNLDSTVGGTSDVLGDYIGLQNSYPITPIITNDVWRNEKYGLGRIGSIEKTTLGELATQLKTILKTEGVRVVGNLEQEITEVAICTGSGMSLFKNVKGRADVYITGDVKFHEAQEARDYGIGLIDVGHYASENIVMPTVKEYLKDFATKHNIEIIVSKLNEEPFIII